MHNISRTSRNIRYLINAFLLAWPIYMTLYWFNVFNLTHIAVSLGFKTHPGPFASVVPGIPTVALTPMQLTLGYLVTMVSISISLFSLYYLARLFQYFELGEFFTKNTVFCLRRSGLFMFLSVLIDKLSDTVVLFINSIHVRPAITIGISNHDINSLFIASIVILAALILDEGRKMQEEQALTI